MKPTTNAFVSHFSSAIERFLSEEKMSIDLIADTCADIYYFHNDCEENFFVVVHGKYFHWSFDCGKLSALHSGPASPTFRESLTDFFLHSDMVEYRSF